MSQDARSHRRWLLRALQGIEDVEDTPEGATMRYLDITDLIERVRANVEAIHVCKSYYMSHAYREVRACAGRCRCCSLQRMLWWWRLAGQG